MTWLRRSILGALLLLASSGRAAEFDFVALGDTAYRVPADLPLYDALIEKINAAKPAFTIHVGDIWGATPCTQEEYDKVRARFQTFRAPLVYTPGDNEWVDCREPAVIEAYLRFLRNSATPEDLRLLAPLRTFEAAYTRKGYDDVLARLADIRRIFFAKPESLGRKPMPLERQADVSDFKDVPENARWTYKGVTFATVHVPGSQNNFFINDAGTSGEAVQRNRAAIAWLESTFAKAKTSDAKAVVIAMHAQLFLSGDGDAEFGQPVRGGGDGPFFWLARALRDLGAEYGRPVLLIHGDFHQLVIDKPFRVSTGETSAPKYDNITRLQVYGAPDVRAVRIRVDTDSPWVFGFTPLY
jgi:hypothetical protein